MQPSDTEVTAVLSLGRAWDVEEADQLVFAWHSLTGAVEQAVVPRVLVGGHNEIGDGVSEFGGCQSVSNGATFGLI